MILMGVSTILVSTSNRYRHRTASPSQKTTSHKSTPHDTASRYRGSWDDLTGVEWNGCGCLLDGVSNRTAPPTAKPSNIVPLTIANNRKPIEPRYCNNDSSNGCCFFVLLMLPPAHRNRRTMLLTGFDEVQPSSTGMG